MNLLSAIIGIILNIFPNEGYILYIEVGKEEVYYRTYIRKYEEVTKYNPEKILKIVPIPTQDHSDCKCSFKLLNPKIESGVNSYSGNIEMNRSKCSVHFMLKGL